MIPLDFKETYSAIILKSKTDARTQEKYYSVSLVKRNTDVHTESEIQAFNPPCQSPQVSYYFASIFETFFSVFLPSIYENKLDAGRILETFTKPDGTKVYTINHLYGLENVLHLFTIAGIRIDLIYSRNGKKIFSIN